MANIQSVTFPTVVCYAGDTLLVSVDETGKVDVMVERAETYSPQSDADFLYSCGIIPY